MGELVEAETRSTIDWIQPCSGRNVIVRHRIGSTNVHLAGGPAQLQCPVAQSVDAGCSCRREQSRAGVFAPKARLRVSVLVRLVQLYDQKTDPVIDEPLRTMRTILVYDKGYD